MFVCLCNGITDSSIRRELQAGARSFSDVQQRLGVASQCGSCELQARAIINEHRALDAAHFYDAAPATGVVAAVA
ncbi:MAG: (2Fe-2S)-binding protein [Luminiphilus sp.]|nr:(2Fe-2S)-binding protein [Luminiphilus sp.]